MISTEHKLTEIFLNLYGAIKIAKEVIGPMNLTHYWKGSRVIKEKS